MASLSLSLPLCVCAKRSSEAYPFERGRRVVFTHAKVMERRDASPSAAPSGNSASVIERPFSLLPTQFLAPQLDASANALDRVLLAQAIGLARLDQAVATQDAAVLQHLVVRVTVRLLELVPVSVWASERRCP